MFKVWMRSEVIRYHFGAFGQDQVTSIGTHYMSIGTQTLFASQYLKFQHDYQ